MGDAIARMAFYLAQADKWKPDRWAVQREKTCTICKKKKHLEKFSFAGSICKTCEARPGRTRYGMDRMRDRLKLPKPKNAKRA